MNGKPAGGFSTYGGSSMKGFPWLNPKKVHLKFGVHVQKRCVSCFLRRVSSCKLGSTMWKLCISSIKMRKDILDFIPFRFPLHLMAARNRGVVVVP